MRGLVPALAAVLLLSGCLGGDRTIGPIDDEASLLGLLTGPDGTQATGGDALQWQGRHLAVDADRFETYTFDVALPDGFWEAHTGSIEVSVHWSYPAYYLQDPNRAVMLQITVYDAHGDAVGTTIPAGHDIAVGTDLEAFLVEQLAGSVRTSTVLLLDALPSGRYTAEVRATAGHTDYQGVVQIEAAPIAAPVTDRAPNLVVLPPTQVVIDYPSYFGVIDPDLSAAGVRGCAASEVVFDEQPMRCLRFGNAVGNTGGPFILYIDEHTSPGGLVADSLLTQRIVRTDGTYRDRDAGTSSYHAHHLHQHVQGITHFQLFEYDLENQMRGEPVTDVRKNGWNPAHTGLVAPDLPGTDGFDTACRVHGPANVEACLGLSSGWYDLYSLELFEQYLEITGVPDGIYELVSSVNIDGVVEETDHADNWAGVVIRLQGDHVEVIGPPTGPY